ncbi:MAG: substrate-binding domain-containing protein [Anaerolineae bacterium]|nr:substrate-binding domain-containing protein [Caldilineales bacterium]MDW8267863.1 substrate-binding domain-containing protein [Anaerolineae bacterium]
MEIYKRRQAILTLLEQMGEASIEDLAARLEVSENTIRNDLKAMEAEGKLRRVRGGAVPGDGHRIPGSMAPPKAFNTRLQAQVEEKKRIGAWAAGLVQDGDAIVLDASTTVYYMATFLQERRHLTVVTNGLYTALLLAQNPTNKVILAANEVRAGGLTVVGRINPDLLNHFYASKCFISAAGFTPDQGLTEIAVDEATSKAEMIKLAREVIALVDHTKFGKIATYRFAEPNQIDRLVTDSGLDRDRLLGMCRRGECTITIVGPEGAETFERGMWPGIMTRTEKRYRIGFGNLTEKMLFAQQVRRSLERAARQYDNIELLIRDNKLDRQVALENADWFVAQGVDLLIEYQIDFQAGNVIMDRLNRAGIPVIAVDIPMPGATFFGADNYRAGFMAGEALGRWVQAHWSGRVDLLIKLEALRVGPGPGARIQGLHEGLESVIGPLSADRVLDLDSPVLVDEAAPFVARLLPDLSRDARIAIVGINDEAVLGALAAFEEAGRLDQVVAVGQNADRLGRAALRRPNFPFIGTTRYAPESYGEKLLPLALRILKGEPVPPAVYNQHVFITRENIDDYYPLSQESSVFEVSLHNV